MNLFKHIGENTFKLTKEDNNPNQLSKTDELRGVQFIYKKLIPYIALTDQRNLGEFTERQLAKTLRKISHHRYNEDQPLDFAEYKSTAKKSYLGTKDLEFAFEIYKVLTGGKYQIRVACGYAHRDTLDTTFNIDDPEITPL